MPRQVSADTAHQRRAVLMEAQQEIAFRKAAALKGGHDTAFLLRAGRRGEWEARSAGQAPEVDGVIRVKGLDSGARAGTFVPVRYTGFAGYDLRATAEVLRG